MAMIPSSSTNNGRLHDMLECLKEMMQQLNSKADDIQTEVQNEELQARKKRKSEVTLWLEQVSSIEEQVRSIGKEVAQVGFFRRGQLSSKLEGMMESVEKLLKQSEFPRGMLLDDFKHEGLELVTEKMEGSTPSRVQNEVWSCFERGEERVGVFGIGGVGKTSLAMHINNQILKLEKRLFKHVCYVTVSRETSVLKLQSDIAKAFHLRLNCEDERKRAAELRMALAKRDKSLLILDDVWEDIAMEEVGVSVVGDGCKLLITTRQRDVCWKMKCCPIHMESLSPEEAWDLFKKQLGNFETLLDEVKDIAASVAKECDGLPLGIVTMARSMRVETRVHVWRDALKRLQNPCRSPPDMENKVFRILRFSYDRLYDDKHQKCFLFCALYPEDAEIERNELVRQFIGAGFVDGNNRKESLDEGHSLLNDLEKASLLECGSGMGDRGCVKMHDLVRDMAIRIIGSTGILKGGKGLLEIPGQEEGINKDVQWVSLMEADGIFFFNMFPEFPNILDMMPECPNVSVFLLQNNPLLCNIPDSFFLRMMGIKVLNLSHTGVEVLPGSVSDLCNLNALLLSGCTYLQYIPSLAKLTKLRDLDLQSCELMAKLPEGMEELASLEHLNIESTEIEGMHREVFMKLVNLESFLGNGKITVPPEELMRMKHLENLFGVHFDDVSGFSRCVGFGWLNQLKTYHVSVGAAQCAHYRYNCYLRNQRVDGKLIKTICWYCVLGGRDCFLFPKNVSRLEFRECSFGGGSLLGDLPSLADATTDLDIWCSDHDFREIECIIPEWWTKPIQCIRRLQVEELFEFGGLIREELVYTYISFSGLKMLGIKKCPKLKKLWMLNLDLPNLEEIEIADCEQMEEIFATEKGGTVKLPRLHSLKLSGLPELRSIWGNCEVFFPHLISLDVGFFPKIKNIGMVSRNLPSLTTIRIHYCEEMEEIFTAEDEAGDNEIHLPKLVELHLYHMPDLRSISGKTIVCNSLQRVSIDAGDSNEIYLPRMEKCPISVSNLSVINNNGPLPVLEASDVPEDWWNTLQWNDPATQSLFHELDCFHYCYSSFNLFQNASNSRASSEGFEVIEEISYEPDCCYMFFEKEPPKNASER